MIHDPRVDPRPGDVVKKEEIGVILITGHDANHVVWFVTQGGSAGWMPREDWRKFAMNAEVLHVAD